jgi:hypothetical protein
MAIGKTLKRSVPFKFAPLYTILFTTLIALVQTVGTRYILKRELKFSKSDIKSAIIGSIWGYFGLRSRKVKLL